MPDSSAVVSASLADAASSTSFVVVRVFPPYAMRPRIDDWDEPRNPHTHTQTHTETGPVHGSTAAPGRGIDRAAAGVCKRPPLTSKPAFNFQVAGVSVVWVDMYMCVPSPGRGPQSID